MKIPGTMEDGGGITIDNYVCIGMTSADDEALRGKLDRLSDLSDDSCRQSGLTRHKFSEIHKLTEEIRGILGIGKSDDGL